MAKFIYSMQNVLNIKERLETQAKQEYAQMQGKLHDEEQTMRAILDKLNAYQQLAKELAMNKLDIAEIRRCSDAIRATEDMAKNQAVKVRIAQKNVENAMDRLTTAVQERKIQEKLKEQAFEEFKQELSVQEMKEIDEVVSFNYNNKDEL
ncbi:MAG: flagellar export protein FliJ [Eubacteriales bacterium]|nr:flagellar export protein FliJ [Eubacteriales bacterium]